MTEQEIINALREKIKNDTKLTPELVKKRFLNQLEDTGKLTPEIKKRIEEIPITEN